MVYLPGMLFTLVSALLVIIVFLFLFWWRLKEDYISDQIFTAAVFILLGILTGSVAGAIFLKTWWFWLAFLGAVVGVVLSVYKFKMRVTEIVEALVLGLLPWFMLICISDFKDTPTLDNLIAVFVVAALLVLYFVLSKHYKSFTWYKSGRVGFTGFVILGLYFSFRSILAIRFPFMLSFSGSYETYVSGTLALLSFLTVFYLARRTT